MYRLAFKLPDIRICRVLEYPEIHTKSNYLNKIDRILGRFLLPIVDVLCGKSIFVCHPSRGKICIHRRNEFVVNLLRSIKRILVPNVSGFGSDGVAKLDREKAFGIVNPPTASTEF